MSVPSKGALDIRGCVSELRAIAFGTYLPRLPVLDVLEGLTGVCEFDKPGGGTEKNAERKGREKRREIRDRGKGRTRVWM